PLSESEALPWINQVCEALDYLHTRTPPIIHRDIKPQNIIVAADGRAVLVDFGISKAYDPSLTTTRGARAVTPGYSPPEQYGMGKTDARSDVYALGATLYTLLTGQAPLESVTLITGMEKLLPVRQANPGVSARTEAAIAAAMALSSSQRLSNATALRNALAGRVVATPVAVPLPAAEPGGRRGVPAWLLAVVGLAAVAIIAVGVYLWLESRRPVSTKATDGVGETATPESEPTKDENEVTAATIDATTAPIAPTAGTPEQTETAELNVTAVPSDRRIVTLPSGVEVVRLFVPDGTFQMGSATNQPEEQPVHKVQLDSFWIDHTPVTNAQFEAYVNALGLQTKAERTNSGYVFTQDGWQPLNGANWRHPQGPGSNIDDRADHPVVLVTWEEARDYCVWSGGRLPTEAEWEYAARGPQNLSYPWGREFDLSMFNFCDRSCPFDWRDSRIDDGFAYTSPVDAFPQGASWMGAYDMLGNVWEWVQDWHDESYYAESPVQNPAGPESGALRVARGGGWPYEVGVEYAANR
ncbi:MAG TPA: bifunctional serine/threonine-protein kinase/formylglycine-generating enzyme family protein, partial [Anaerolineae bacterium]|nr:bifunctional serine/threonine-protein kinase/formylglycine-generating enzyme family protein [Anaerolineae bacterium]